jgi:hypothetical protein
MITNLRPLTQDERQQAQQSARKAVLQAIGPQPVREHFAHHALSKYPESVTRLITGLCTVLLFAAFTPSAIRLFVIGSRTFGQAVSNQTAMQAVGIATVLSAEVGQIVFSLALATFGRTPRARQLLYCSMGIATLISLTGNIQISLPGHLDSPFAWLEAMAPPILVLSTAYVLKEQILDAIQQRHANECAYQAELVEWQVAVQQPEQHPHWKQFYANALRDALRKANHRKQEALTALTMADWRDLVSGEFQAELWYVESQENELQLSGGGEKPQSIPLAILSGHNGHGAHLG